MNDVSTSEAGNEDSGQMALAIYILYLVGFATGGLTTIIGLIMAYVYKDTAPDWLRSHYVNAIHVFWKGLLYLVVSILLCAVLIGFLLLLVQTIWFIVRCAKGIQGVSSGRPYADPESWGF